MTSIRQNDANAIRVKILKQGLSEPIQPEPELMICYDYSPEFAKWTFRWLCVIFLVCCFMQGCQKHAFAYTPEMLANAIYKTENSSSYPYGVLVHYRHTTPRQACLNTIKHKLSRWNRKGDFVVFLGETYSPPSINPNWVRLVRYFLKKEIKNV